MISKKQNNSLFINSIEKAFFVIEAFKHDIKELSLTDIVKLTGLNKSAAQRYIYTLETLGYLEKNPNSKLYRLSIKNLFPASNYLNHNILNNVASAYVVKLREKFDARFGLSIIHNNKICYLIAIQSNREVFATDYPGFCVPIYCTSSGRMFMTKNEDDENRMSLTSISLQKYTKYTKTNVNDIIFEIQKARENSFCITIEEYAMGHINLSVPIIHKNQIKACIVAIVHKTKWELSEVENTLLADMQEAALIISRKLNL